MIASPDTVTARSCAILRHVSRAVIQRHDQTLQPPPGLRRTQYSLLVNPALGLSIDYRSCESAWDSYGIDNGLAVVT